MPKVKKQLKRAAKAVARTAKPIAKAAINAAKREATNQLRSTLGRLNLSGRGDYKTNSIVGGAQSSTTPSFGTTNIRLQRREFVAQVVSSSTPGAFNLVKYTINPGLLASFPWASILANMFETWRPHGLIYEFRTTSGTAIGSTNTALGEVIMAPQYNAYGLDPASLLELQGFPHAVVTVPSANALCGVECMPNNRQSNALLIRNSNVTTAGTIGADALFDLGDFFIATAGLQAASVVLGELWVCYDIEFTNPIIPRGLTSVGFYSSVYTGVTTPGFFNGVLSYFEESNNLYVNAVGATLVLNLEPNRIYMLQVGSILGAPAVLGTTSATVSSGATVTDSYQAPLAGANTTSKYFEAEITTGAITGPVTVTLATTVIYSAEFFYRILRVPDLYFT